MIKYLKTDCKRIENEILSLQNSLQAKQNSLAHLENLTEQLNKAIPENYKKLLSSCNLSVDISQSAGINASNLLVITRLFNPPLIINNEKIYNASIKVELHHTDFEKENMIYNYIIKPCVHSTVLFPNEFETNWFVKKRQTEKAEEQERIAKLDKEFRHNHSIGIVTGYINSFFVANLPNLFNVEILNIDTLSYVAKLKISKGDENILFSYGVVNRTWVGFENQNLLFETVIDLHHFIVSRFSFCEIEWHESKHHRYTTIVIK